MKKQLKLIFTAFFLVSAITLVNAIKVEPDCNSYGTVRLSDVEGGCWYIKLDNGEQLEPIGDALLGYKIDGMRIKFSYSTGYEIATICQIGEPAMIHCIQTIDTLGIYDTIGIFDTLYCWVDFKYTVLRCGDSIVNERCGENSYCFNIIDSTGNMIELFWLVNDVVVSGDREMFYRFEDDGKYKITLKVKYEDGCTTQQTKWIQIGQEKCKAAFDYYPLDMLMNVDSLENMYGVPYYFITYPVNGASYYFMDKSIGDVIEREWTFDGDSTYSMANVYHTFTDSGMHKVCLTIETSDGCSSTYCEEIFVDLLPEPCGAGFRYYYDPFLYADSFEREAWMDSAYYDSIFAEKTVYFYDISMGTYDEVLWNFGDSTTSSESNPVHVYADYGSYLVCLSIISDSSCNDTYCTWVNVYPPNICHAYFEYCNYSSTDSIDVAGNENYLVGFKGIASSDVNTWKWKFGDGTVGYGQNPFHGYANRGTYPVCLEIWGEGNCYDIYCMDVVVGKNCEIDFNWEVLFADCSGYLPAYEFEILGMDSFNYIYWDFGDGTNAIYEANPIHAYDTWGEYRVCLEVEKANGCHAVKCKYINQYFDQMDSLHLKDCGTSIKELIKEDSEPKVQKIYPNPVLDKFIIELYSPISGTANIGFIDMIGTEQLIKEVEVEKGLNEMEMDMSQLKKGNYIYKIVSGQYVIRGLIMKE